MLMLTLTLMGGCAAVEAGLQMHVTLAVDLGEFLMLECPMVIILRCMHIPSWLKCLR
jgi:hypothetical protein